MKTSQEIFEEKQGDLGEVLKEMDVQMASAAVPFTPLDQIMALEAYVNAIVEYLGEIHLQLAESVGALPEGLDVERQKFARFVLVLKRRTLYDVIEAKAAAETGLITPDQLG